MQRSTLTLRKSESDERVEALNPAQERVDASQDRFHVAIIMDGNGRWARSRGRPRAAGHVAGVSSVNRAVESAPGCGITTLTLYAFSSDNWRRPRGEVVHLMRLLQSHLESQCDRLIEHGVRLSVIGRRDRIPEGLKKQIQLAESRTLGGTVLHLRVAVDYSSRDALLAAASQIGGADAGSRELFEERMARTIHAPVGTRDVDLLIRTGGERRLSDFLLWESAYAELYFTDVLWPDFGELDLAAAVRDFAGRDRRFGGLTRPTHVHSGTDARQRRAGP